MRPAFKASAVVVWTGAKLRRHFSSWDVAMDFAWSLHRDRGRRILWEMLFEKVGCLKQERRKL